MKKYKHEFFRGHIEFHNVDPKHEKASNCIFLHEDRSCQNSESPMYLGKCFVASHCKYRIKDPKMKEIRKSKPTSKPKANTIAHSGEDKDVFWYD